jgi:transposase-like protein
MGRSKRIRRGSTGWLKLFSRQLSSGLAVREFCRREGINASLFRRWQSRLAGSGSDGKITTAVAISEPFIDLGDLRAGGQRLEVRLDLGGGLVLSIARS